MLTAWEFGYASLVPCGSDLAAHRIEQLFCRRRDACPESFNKLDNAAKQWSADGQTGRPSFVKHVVPT
jgi:hypothetical protein